MAQTRKRRRHQGTVAFFNGLSDREISELVDLAVLDSVSVALDEAVGWNDGEPLDRATFSALLGEAINQNY